MKRRLIGVALALGMLGAGLQSQGCATAKDPHVRVLQNTDNTITVLGTLAHAVANAADTKLITVNQAHQVLDIIKAAVITIDKTPEGGYAVASAALTEVEFAVPPDVRAKIAPYLLTTRAALEAFRAGK